MFVGAALYTITVIVAVTIIKHYRNKARRLAMASVLKRISHEDGCYERHCSCVK